MNTPLVSVNMIAYNVEKYISESIQSVIDQTYQNWELIIVEDGSSDGTWKIIQEFAQKDTRIKPHTNNQNEGIVYSRNRAVHYSEGKYIAVLDSDDISLPERLEKQVKFMEGNKEYGLVGCSQNIIDEEGKLISECIFTYPQECYRAILSFYNHIPHSSMLTRKELLLKNLYRPLVRGYSPAEDYRFVVEVSKDYKVWNLPEILICYREHQKGISKERKDRIDQHINEIIFDQLKINNIKLDNDRSIDFHKTILGYSLAKNKEELNEAIKWILILLKANNKHQAFPRIGYSLYLYLKMTEIIRANLNLKSDIIRVWLKTVFHFSRQLNFGYMIFLLKRIRYESYAKK